MASLAGQQREIIDTPGTNTLIPQSEDERVTRDVLLSNPEAEVIQVGDLKNLRRTLLLSLQLAEWRIPFTLCLNMSDEASDQGIEVDAERLAEILGVSVIKTPAVRRWGIDRLIREAISPRQATSGVGYHPRIETAVSRIEASLPQGISIASRPLALAILAGDETIVPWLEALVGFDALRELDRTREETQADLRDPLAYRINRDRLAQVDLILAEVFTAPERPAAGFRHWLGAVTMHRSRRS